MANSSTISGTAELTAETVGKFAAGLRGEVFRPGDPGYDPARRLFNAMVDKRPGLIVRCRDAPDVMRAVEFARLHNLLVAVRGGGHNVAGKALCDGGVVIDLSAMKGIRFDPSSRTVRAEGGLTWGEFDRQTQEHGLATTGGFISTTGIGGLTLGGGLGWLMRKYGIVCDNLRSVEIVTADGQLLTASPEENPELFWGVRGGGGNFGVVTSFEYQLHPVGQLLAGVLFYPLDQAGAAFRHYREVMATAPDELMAYAGFLTSPEGVRLFAIPVCYVGPVEKGEQILRPLRSFGKPAADLVQPMSYVQLQTMFDAGFPHGRRNYWKSNFLRELTDEAIDILIKHFAAVPSPYSAVFLEPFGGAVGRVANDETAFPHRRAVCSLVLVSMWTDPTATTTNITWTRELWNAMQPFATEAVYVNYLDTDDADRVQAAYGSATYQRLRRLKEKYDPENFFRVNQNIGPAA
jgi:FAD/FMN-containing dehydrogenase